MFGSRSALRVKQPPAEKPLMVYDGDCGFCRRWIGRWQRTTKDRVDYAPSQQILQDFPEISPEAYKAAVQLIEPDGRVSSGAEAVFRSLRYGGKRWPLWLYEHVPGVARVCELGYRFIAGHRPEFSRLTQVFWGSFLGPPSYALAQYLFLRLLALAYLIAFLSLWTQIDGLIGPNGILPSGKFLEAVREHYGAKAYWLAPTLCWVNTGPGMLHFLCAGGMVAAGLVAAGFAQAPLLALCWLFYLSLTTVSQTFLSFQWDNLLLEAGLLAIFLAPLQLRPVLWRELPPSSLPLWLLRWLLFRLMFGSAVVKLASHDSAWRDLSALQYHYETQPLPPWTAWYLHHLPALFHKASAVFMFAVELIAPFFIFGPRRFKLAACFAFLGLQALIAASGNYGFFNLLSVFLCVLLIDDDVWPRRWRDWLNGTEQTPVLRRARMWPTLAVLPIAFLVVLVSSFQKTSMLYSWVAPLRSINTYGLFAVMTTSRPEIIIEGSNDAQSWSAYEFKWKPGDLHRRPGFVAPHQPRLDWQMWFAALGNYEHNPWLMQFMGRLLEGSQPVLGLLEQNPFPDSPPHYVRAVLYDYHFSEPDATDPQAWWRREYKGLYCPVLTLRNAQ